MAVSKKNVSGKKWWISNQGKAAYANSTSIDKLDSTFKLNIIAFKKAIIDAGANITISTTRRSEKRAYLLHWSWKIAKGLITADKVPAKSGVDIVWDHGDKVSTRKAAQEMVILANIKYLPSLTSNHIRGKAIDWTITWTGNLKIKNKAGKEIEISSEPRHGGKGRTNNGNTDIHAIGKTYGVIKAKFIKIDGPHWSLDGR